MRKSKLFILLTLVLAVCTLIGVMAFSASAAEADHPHTTETTHCVCGGSNTFCTNDHATASVTWTAWTNGMTSPTSGNYYLAEDVTITAAISLKGSFKLCLNGYTLTVSGGARAFTYVGSSYLTLEICDCSIAKAGKITVSNTGNQGGVVYFGRGKFCLYSGTLENTATTSTTSGGIVRLGQAGNTADKVVAFWMYGGTLQGGIAKSGGSIYAANSANITINLLGGTIAGGHAIDGDGGNIYVGTGTLKLEGSTVTGGTASGNGGNIYCVSTMTMSDGWVYGGSAEASMGGDNVRVQNTTGSLTMSGGYIGETDQTATNAGHNLSLLNTTFTMTGGTIKGLVRTNATSAASVNLSGDARITGTEQNLLISADAVAVSVDELTDKASVGVTLGASMTTDVFATATADPAGKITSDSDYCEITYADGQLQRTAKTMQVGYSKVSIAPAVGTPLGGYGFTEERLSTGNDDTYGLMATCIAITDSEGETVLLITADLVSLPGSVVTAARTAITEATGVPADHIMLAATHTHTAPDLTLSNNEAINTYKTELYANLTAAAQAAIADQTTATASVGSVEIAGQNYVRHYTDDAGNYYGYEYWASQAIKNGTALTNAAEADCTMQHLKFDRGSNKTPVVIANWQTHPHILGRVDYASADLVGAFRDALGTTQGWNVAYFSGASGNVNADSLTVNDDKTYVSMGQAMAEVAATVEFTNAGLDSIETRQKQYAATLKDVTEEQYNAAVAFLETVTSATTNADAGEAGFNSVSHAKSIRTVYTLKQSGSTVDLELNTISLGQVAFVTAPYEMFDVNGETVKASKAHNMTFVLTLANGANGYIPSDLSDKTIVDGVYELDATRFVTGTGEKLANTYVSMLAAMVSEEYCVCGGSASGKSGHSCDPVSWQAFPENGVMPTSGNYYLSCNLDISFSSGEACTLNGDLAIDLRGYTLTLTPTAGGRVFGVGSGETLSICDTVGGGKITAVGTTAQIGGLIFNNKGTVDIYSGSVDASELTSTKDAVTVRNAASSTVNIYGGTVIGGTTIANGGAISNAGELNLRGGHIVGGTAKNGGAVYNSGSGATLEMVYSSTITGGTASANGGAVYNGGSAALKLTGTGTQITGGMATGNGGNVFMTSGTTRVSGKISGGTAALGGNLYTAAGNTWLNSRVGEGAAQKGGNIYHAGGGLYLFDAAIRNAVSGGGIYATANFTVGGTAKTVANKMDENTTVNVYLAEGVLITAGTESTPLKDGASIGITMDNMEAGFATNTIHYEDGLEPKDVFFSQGTNSGIEEVDGVLYFRRYAARAYYAEDGEFKSKGYYTIEEAMAHEGMIYVALRADYEGNLTVSRNLYLDLAGFSINGTVTVADGYTLYGMDSNTDDYDIADGYGKIAIISGDYAMVHGEKLTTDTKRYVTIEEEAGISFHRYYAALTAISLKPADDALGYKAEFHGDELVRNAVSGFGFNMWVEGGSIKTYIKDGSFTDGQVLTLRLKNILSANGGEMNISAQAVVKFSHVEELAVGSKQSTTMKSVLQTINAAWDNYTETKQEAVKALCAKFAVTSDWELDKILPVA